MSVARKTLIFQCFQKYRYLTSAFNRPGFTALLEEIEAGRVDTLVVKDLSRFGRNYLQVGYYTEIVFPKKGVRFIAINNNVDSANPTENDFTPFLNIMNEWYAKDTSNKIKAVFKSRMKEGLRCSGAIPYGYKRINGDKQTLVELAKTDEEAAKKLAEMRKYQSQATVRSYQKMKADAEAGDPDAIKRYETTLAKRREEYHRKKGA